MLVPILILIFLIATKKSILQKLFPEYILKRLFVKNYYLSKNMRNALLFCALILMTIALARPVIEQKEQTIKQEVTPIVVAIDVSKSMLASDIAPTRLSLAKRKLQEIIKHSSHNALGVLLFAKSAFILSPITQDFTSLNYLVERFDQGLNFDNGSNIYAVIEAANKLFATYNNKNLLLLTDGGNNRDFQKEIDLANEHNIAVYTLVLATNNPTPIKLQTGFLTDKDNNIVMVKRNENIKKLSFQTKGGYIDFTLNNSDIQAILNDIESKSAKEVLKDKKIKTFTELFYYPLALSLIVLLLAFSSLPRKQLALVMGILFCIHPHNSMASILDFKTINDATKAYENQEFKKAAKGFKEVSNSNEGHYNYANALYKNKNYKEALKEYKKVITSKQDLEFKKLHNMGNTYVKLNQLQDAIKMYEKALELQEDNQTKENLKRVKEALKQQKKNKQDNSKNNNQKKQDKQKNPQENKNNASKNQDSKSQKKRDKQKSQPSNQAQKNQNKTADKTKNKEGETNTAKQQKANKLKQQQEPLKEVPISDLEERKWLQKLQQNRTKVLLRKVPSKEAEENTSTPW